jgi:hypothetical protein
VLIIPSGIVSRLKYAAALRSTPDNEGGSSAHSRIKSLSNDVGNSSSFSGSSSMLNISGVPLALSIS